MTKKNSLRILHILSRFYNVAKDQQEFKKEHPVYGKAMTSNPL